MRALISRLQLLRDQVRRKLGIMLFDRHRTSQPIDKEQLQHIVFLRTDAKFGDAFVSSFIFKDIKVHYPNVKLTVVTAPNMRDLFLNHLGADSVIELKKRPSYKEITKACIEVGECDLLVSLNLNLKMKDLFFLNQCKAKHIAGLDDSLNAVDIKLGAATQALHFAERFGALLGEIDVPANPHHYIIPQTESSTHCAQAFINTHSLLGFCVINAYGSGNARKLNAHSVEKLVTLVKQDCPELSIVLISAPDTFEQTEQMIKEHQLDAIHYNVSKTIFDVASLIAAAKFVITVDTAIVHMASGLRVPQLAFYNPDPANFNQWHPNSDLAITSMATHCAVPDINALNWLDVEQKLAQLILKNKDI
ncbi:lipopolysaccharide heptosyltransferase family protein [Vibrio sp. ZSDZ65]|uniref:Lipopolysaccharide heptosyltransferase family protein n=1 Tax=Vibrio qingdaonensis TaxID=2829491 RepID=A0A9X3HXT1_9VIBR|nr:glycosyltransferase family 9 protein [Vibrio qingdaonensis]MCW8348065.1 lipopolysaccharide heptosyltransferase family protein [Vibrio qingdaonensis]